MDSQAPIQARVLSETGFVSRVWALFFANISDRVNGKYPVKLPSHTVANVPDASSYTGNIAYISDETGGATLAFSDGTNWRRVQDRAIIS